MLPEYLSLSGTRLRLGEDVVAVDRFRNIYLAGAGKASGEMAVACEKILGELITDGVVAVKNFPDKLLKRIRLISGGHPTPNLNSVLAANDILSLAQKAGKDDLLIFLLSGGASSLLTDLPAICTIEEMNYLSGQLINSGAGIDEINTVRKHLSQIKGGNLARVCSCSVACFVISDVPSNDLSTIGSGPFTPDNTSFADAMQVIKKYGLEKQTPPAVVDHLKKGMLQMIPDNPRKGDRIFQHVHNFIIGDLQSAIRAAAVQAGKIGYKPIILHRLLTGNTIDEARMFVNEMQKYKGRPVCLIAGGETSIAVSGKGMGGRNQHFALSCLSEMKSLKPFSILAAGTDGNDGPTDAAGAFADAETCNAFTSLSLDPETYLNHFDSYHFFQQTRSLFTPGPTGTNVMDLVIAFCD